MAIDYPIIECDGAGLHLNASMSIKLWLNLLGRGREVVSTLLLVGRLHSDSLLYLLIMVEAGLGLVVVACVVIVAVSVYLAQFTSRSGCSWLSDRGWSVLNRVSPQAIHVRLRELSRCFHGVVATVVKPTRE